MRRYEGGAMTDTVKRLRQIAILNSDRATVLERLAEVISVSPGTNELSQVHESAALSKRRSGIFIKLADIEGEIKSLDPTRMITMPYLEDTVSSAQGKPLRFLLW